MRYRKFDANGDMVFGQGQRSFWRDVPEAPAAAVLTRMELYQGEWFLDLSDGTPWKTRVLGKGTAPTRDIVLQLRALQTPGVKGIATWGSQVNRNTREFDVQMTLDTIFGNARLTTPLSLVPPVSS